MQSGLMDPRQFEAASPLAGTEEGLPHLAGPAAAVRQVLAAHFLRDCEHILEIGGHLRPITPYVSHCPRSVLSIDPKTEPYAAEELNGHPCRVRHLQCKFQEVEYDYAPYSYGLVMLGYSLKPFGRREPLGKLLFSLLDHARTIVIEYPPALHRAASQVPEIIARPTLRSLCTLELVLDDEAIAGSPYARRRLHVLKPRTV